MVKLSFSDLRAIPRLAKDTVAVFWTFQLENIRIQSFNNHPFSDHSAGPCLQTDCGTRSRRQNFARLAAWRCHSRPVELASVAEVQNLGSNQCVPSETLRTGCKLCQHQLDSCICMGLGCVVRVLFDYVFEWFPNHLFIQFWSIFKERRI